MTADISIVYDLGIPHNKFSVALPDGTHYPDWVLTQDLRPAEFLQQYERVRTKDWVDCTFLDLGCSEGTTTLNLSQMGSTVYGVEGRADGIERANAIKSLLGRDTVHFSVGNVNEASAFREVDGVFNAGILYHLDNPIEFLIRCCNCARDFVYVDTGHAPKDDEELRNSKFAPQFGRRHTLVHDGLELDAIDFAEPGDVRETNEEGIRRGPRSGIGNTNSVWLSHESLIALMKKHGFPYHETLKYAPVIPRKRTAFFRTEPRETPAPLQARDPLPDLLPPAEATLQTMARDLAYLRSATDPITVIGREPLLSTVVEHLKDAGISVSEAVGFPGTPDSDFPQRPVMEKLKDRSGIIVTAVPNPTKTIVSLVRLNRFKIAITSFGVHFGAVFSAADADRVTS